jgi:hypothetical protein
MSLQVGDRIRTATGHEGEIKLLSDGDTIAYVQLDEHSRGIRLTLFETDTLTKVEDFAPRYSTNYSPQKRSK